MNDQTPGSRVTNPPTPAAGAQNANGSHVTTVHDPAHSLAAAFLCLAWVRDDRRLCALPVGHAGSHLALPVPWPRKEITRTNPAYTRRTA